MVPFIGEIAAEFEMLSILEGRSVIQRWRNVFSSSVKERTGKWVIESIDWHTFSYRYHPFIVGNQALEKFYTNGCDDVYIWFSDDLGSVFYIQNLQKHALIEFAIGNRQHLDIYLFDESGEWTFILTHERDFEFIYADA